MRNQNRVLMKSILLIAMLTLGLLPGMSQQAEAQHCGQRSQVYISGYQRCGTPIYRVRYIAGYNSCGQAVWRTRGLTYSERNRYYRSYRPTYRSSTRYYGHAGYGQSRITYSTSSGRGYTYRYSSSPSSCRVW